MSKYTDQINEIQEDYHFLIKAVTRQGFFELYFKELPKHRTNFECFNALNEKYFDLVGEYRYSSFQSFINQLRKR